MSNKVLPEKHKKGDILSFEKLIAPYERKVYNYCLCMVCCRKSAMDICQKVFITLYEKSERWNTDQKLGELLYKIAYEICKEHLESKGLTTPKQGEGDCLLESLMELTIEERNLLILRDIHQLTSEEIGKIAGLSISEVRQRAGSARIRLLSFIREKKGRRMENGM